MYKSENIPSVVNSTTLTILTTITIWSSSRCLSIFTYRVRPPAWQQLCECLQQPRHVPRPRLPDRNSDFQTAAQGHLRWSPAANQTPKLVVDSVPSAAISLPSLTKSFSFVCTVYHTQSSRIVSIVLSSELYHIDKHNCTFYSHLSRSWYLGKSLKNLNSLKQLKIRMILQDLNGQLLTVPFSCTCPPTHSVYYDDGAICAPSSSYYDLSLNLTVQLSK